MCLYLRENRTQVILLKVNADRSLEVCADADFNGNWNIKTAEHDVSTKKSRTGFILFCRLPYHLGFSSSNADHYINKRSQVRSILTILTWNYSYYELLIQFKSKERNVVSTSPGIVCTVFEDNNGAIEVANVTKMRARTKHITLVYYHFRELIIQKKINIKPIDMSFQMTDVFIKLLCSELFLHHCTSMKKTNLCTQYAIKRGSVWI